MKTTITALCNQKGGVGKTTSCLNLGVGLAQEGKKVLLVDCDPQGSLTISTGCAQPDSLQDTLSTAMLAKMMDTPYDVSRAILRHGEGVDILPANIELSGVEVTMVNAMSREKILKQTLEPLKEKYDHILLDCMPSLSMLTVNALAAANSVVIPVQAQYLSAKGLEQLLGTIVKVRRQINPKLTIEGKRLTLKAKGLMSVMLSLPENWDYTLRGLSAISKEGVDAISEAVKELERSGYVIRNRKRDERGRLSGTEYLIYEDCHMNSQPAQDAPEPEKPKRENPRLENPVQEKPVQENPK